MITELSAQNFKSWQDTGKLQLAPLTGLFGANNSGKTSILQVLLLLKQTAEHPSPDWNEPLYFGSEGSLVNLGNFNTVINRHNPTFTLGISVSWKLPEHRNIGDYSTNSLSFSTTIIKNVEQSELRDFHYTTVDGYNFWVSWTSQENPITPKGYIVKPRGYMTSPVNISVDPFRCYGVVNRAGLWEPFLQLQEAFENRFSRIHYLGPRRDDPRHDYTWGESHPKDIGQYGEKMISALLSSRVKFRSTDEQIMKWLQRLELIDSYTLNPTSNTDQYYEFLVKQYKGGTEVGLTDVGFGVSQILPVLILCYYADEGSILVLEQPEAHLHPKAQSELADVLIDVVKNRNIQIILESHSEHLLLRLMRRIAEEKISMNDTALYFCHINNGTSEIERLNMDEYGNIRNWPQDFFGDSTGELIKKTKAEMQRRKVIG